MKRRRGSQIILRRDSPFAQVVVPCRNSWDMFPEEGASGRLLCAMTGPVLDEVEPPGRHALAQGVHDKSLVSDH